MEQSFSPSRRDLLAAIIAGCMVAFIGFGFAASFGVFLRPMSVDLSWPREIFSLSIALQALFRLVWLAWAFLMLGLARASLCFLRLA